MDKNKINKNFCAIPALDIYRGGLLVRLQQGDFQQQKKEYSFTAQEKILEYLEQGAFGIHTVDLAGAEAGQPANQELFKKIGILIRQFEKNFGKKINWQVGGGIRTKEDVERVFNEYGALKIILGGAFIDREIESGILSELIKKFGKEKFIVDLAIGISSLDPTKKVLKKNAWQEDVNLPFEDALELLKKIGIKEVIVTGKELDGMGKGPNLVLASYVKEKGFKVTASGGVASINDCLQALEYGLDKVIVGKALLDNKFSFTELNKAIKNKKMENENEIRNIKKLR